MITLLLAVLLGYAAVSNWLGVLAIFFCYVLFQVLIRLAWDGVQASQSGRRRK